jgi:Ras-related protein Rab-39B
MPTLGLDFKIKTIRIDDKTIKIQLWDTAGQERFRSIIKAYYRNVVGGFLIFDVKDRLSFDELSNCVEDAKEGAYPRELIFVLVGNKIDEDYHPRVVSQQEAKEFAQRFGMEYIETSAKTGQNIDELLPFLASRVYWKLRVRDIVLEEGWKGVTEGDLYRIQKPQLTSSLQLQHAPPPKNSGSCCN